MSSLPSQSELKPLLVSVQQTRQLLSISEKKFWSLVAAGHFDLRGTHHKRYVTMASIEKYIDGMKRYVPQSAREAKEVAS
ncbi:MAG TPA: hypothetical protein VKG24_02950 [Pseudolabrys sp.]|nr:hypothetical protein [Pseudolabrys sp.]